MIHRSRDRQPATALTVMARHHRSVEPQATQACYGRDHPVNDSDGTEHHRPPVTALTVVMDGVIIDPSNPRRGKLALDAASLSTTRTPPNVIANRPLLTVMMALHPHLINPNHQQFSVNGW